MSHQRRQGASGERERGGGRGERGGWWREGGSRLRLLLASPSRRHPHVQPAPGRRTAPLHGTAARHTALHGTLLRTALPATLPSRRAQPPRTGPSPRTWANPGPPPASGADRHTGRRRVPPAVLPSSCGGSAAISLSWRFGLPSRLPGGDGAKAELGWRGRTSSASPKNSSPSFFDLGFFVRAKKASSILLTSAPFTSTDAEVEMQYAWFTRLRGTPFSWYGPVTSSRPEDSCLRKTTRLPRKRPPSRISTEPGLMVFLSFATPREWASRSLGTFALMSSAGYHLGALTSGTSRSLPFLPPPIAFFTLLEKGRGGKLRLYGARKRPRRQRGGYQGATRGRKGEPRGRTWLQAVLARRGSGGEGYPRNHGNFAETPLPKIERGRRDGREREKEKLFSLA